MVTQIKMESFSQANKQYQNQAMNEVERIRNVAKEGQWF